MDRVGERGRSALVRPVVHMQSSTASRLLLLWEIFLTIQQAEVNFVFLQRTVKE
jgi:hypothetical protein